MKKLIALLLALVMVLSLAACGGNDTPATNAPANNDVQTPVDTDEPEVKPDPVTVKWVLRTDPQDDDEEVLAYLNELLVEKGNVKLELIPVSSGEYDTRCQLITTGGEDYDLMFTCNWTNSFNANMSRGSFMALDDLINSEAGALLKESVPSFVFSAATVNGEIYAVPNYQVMANQLCIVIQKDMAEKYNLDVDSIKTVTDIEPFLQQIVDNEPDYIPMCETDSVISAGIDNKRDGLGGNTTILANDPDFTVTPLHEESEWLSWFKTMNEWFKKGYLRSDMATVTDNTADLVANKYVCRVTQYKPGIESEILATYGEEYIAIKINTPYVQYTQPVGTMNAINVNSKNPEAAITLLGLFYGDEEVYNTFMYGIEGKHYNKTGDNRVEQIENSGYSRADIGWEYGNQFNQWLLPSMADDVWTLTEEMNTTAMPSPLMGYVADRESVQTEYANLNATHKEYEKGLITAVDFDAYLAQYIAAMEAAGMDTYVTDMQAKVDAWADANGK